MWIEEFNRAERLCSSGFEYSGFGWLVSKHGERFARIAGVLTVFEESDLIVSEKIMESAIELGKWHLLESIRIIGAGSLKPEINDDLDLIEWFRKNIFRLSKNTNHLSDNTESGFESTNNEFKITKGYFSNLDQLKFETKLGGIQHLRSF